MRKSVAVAVALVCAVVGTIASLGASSATAPVAALGTSTAAAPVGAPLPVAAAADQRPNILLITTDDMTDAELRYMPRTRRLLGKAGVNMTDFINPHPLCCPARAEILTGQYAQNNGVHHNKGRYGGYDALANPDEHVARYLQESGYRTAFVGKFLHGYDPDRHPVVGWDFFSPSVKRTYMPYGFTYLNNGDPVRIKGVYTADYVARETRRLVKEYAGGGAPFFLWASHIAPHTMRRGGRWVPPIPAERHKGMFLKAKPPSQLKPSYNEKDMRDKPSSLGRDPVDDREMRRWYRQRLRSLQSVDQAVAKAVRVLREQGVLRNTLIVFTSDNGFLLGEHRFATKNVPYEEAMQVPLLMRGPGVTRGVVTTKTATMIDLAPTFLDIAGVGGRSAMDGRSLFTTLLRRGYRKTLIQAGVGDRPWMYRGVRTPRWTYVRYADGFEELYDRRRDPYQLHNLVVTNPDARMRRKRAEFRTALRGLRNCAGATCRSRSFR